MNWSKWFHKLGLEASTALVTVAGIGLSVFLITAMQRLVGQDVHLLLLVAAMLLPVLTITPLTYFGLELFFRNEELETELIRKDAQIETLQKQAAGQSESEKEQLIRDLNSFAQTVAHDLKTPLTTITGFATMLADQKVQLPLEQQREALQMIVKTSLKMNNILQELMLLSAVRQANVRTGPIQMGHVVNQARQRLWGILTDSQAQLIVPEASAWPRVIGYAAWVEEIWINYISNAVKYGGAPPRIELGFDPDYKRSPSGHRMARFWVRDNGKGIAPEDQAQLFTQFTRLDQMRAEGHGLGLSIVARILEKLGGEYGVESTPGQGSLFYFTLPMAVNEPTTRSAPKRKK
ncbi:MAG: HAMP domain-containing histidine kinase [Anaerolineales bacterium]|nr:HAMP domain-containing histidine kinase [Anaerolineales bacterium]MDW8276442.1 HAMP domain-containing sensor histidine kinase [Anaerolineales bacterium]